MLTVATVLKSGGIYTPEWVAKLKAGVERHLKLPHRFVCLSDVDVPCERIPLEHDWPGWWSKIELFKLEGPVLYFDLDTAIVGDLSDIAFTAGNPLDGFKILQDFYRKDGWGSGVMGWSGRHVVEGWFKAFAERPEFWMQFCGIRGDQHFIENMDHKVTRTWQRLLPNQIVSYKVHCCNAQLLGGNYFAHHIPNDARAVCLHGLPKFRDMPANDAVRLAWERAA